MAGFKLPPSGRFWVPLDSDLNSGETLGNVLPQFFLPHACLGTFGSPFPFGTLIIGIIENLRILHLINRSATSWTAVPDYPAELKFRVGTDNLTLLLGSNKTATLSTFYHSGKGKSAAFRSWSSSFARWLPDPIVFLYGDHRLVTASVQLPLIFKRARVKWIGEDLIDHAS